MHSQLLQGQLDAMSLHAVRRAVDAARAAADATARACRERDARAGGGSGRGTKEGRKGRAGMGQDTAALEPASLLPPARVAEELDSCPAAVAEAVR